jgi:hypothetical protein
MKSLAAIAFALLLSTGCASNHGQPTTRPTSARDRQDQALHDPFGYKPDMSDQDISAGDIGSTDAKALRKDVDHVLNP